MEVRLRNDEGCPLPRVGQDGDGDGRAVYPAVSFGSRDPLHPVTARLVLPAGQVRPLEEQEMRAGRPGRLAPAQSALVGGEAGVGPRELGGEEFGVLAALGGADLDAQSHDVVLSGNVDAGVPFPRGARARGKA